MTDIHDGRGVLYPAKLPTFHREPAPKELNDFVRWFWIARWNLPVGRSSRQTILPFPASNLVIEPTGTSLVGPVSAASYRDLSGSGWVIGALLRPAAIAPLQVDPQHIRDGVQAISAPDLRRRISAAMQMTNEDSGRQSAVTVYVDWAIQYFGQPTAQALLANRMEALIESDRGIIQVEQLAETMNLSVRSIQRLARRYIGLPPLAVIRRYRLQEAAQRLREDASVTIAQIAADLGYADHAHLASDFRKVLGFTANTYRQETRTSE